MVVVLQQSQNPLWPHISCWRDTDGRGPPSRWCHFVWVVLRCGFAAFGCWQGIKDFCWHGVALFQQGGKLTQGGVTGGKCVIECSLKTRQDEGIFGSSLLAHLFGFEQMCITSVLPSRSLHAFYSHSSWHYVCFWFFSADSLLPPFHFPSSCLHGGVLLIRARGTRRFVCYPIRRIVQRGEECWRNGSQGNGERGILEISSYWILLGVVGNWWYRA